MKILHIATQKLGRKPTLILMQIAFLGAICAGLTSCIGVNQIAPAPIGSHPEDAPSPSGKRLSN